MTSQSGNSDAPEHHGPHRFGPGNKFGRGNPLARATQLFRSQIIKELKAGKRIPRLMRRLFHLASGAVPVRMRVNETDKESGKITVRQQTIWMPVEPATQLNAIKELLSRGVGKATEFKVIEDASARPPVVVSVEAVAAVLDRLGVPPDRQPPEVQEYRRRKAESRVLEPPQQA
jgi:hypothetical protein